MKSTQKKEGEEKSYKVGSLDENEKEVDMVKRKKKDSGDSIFLLSLAGVFLGIIGLTGITTTLSLGVEKFYEPFNLGTFLVSALFVGLSIALLREALK